jgi:endonuclease/exonuclease/phosphatase family metal-dependent hydrolase
MKKSLKFLTLNIELRKHLDLIAPFLHQYQPDIICFQEMMRDTFEEFKKDLGMEGVFSHRAVLAGESEDEGTAILSKYPIQNYSETDYEKFTDPIPGMNHLHECRPISKLLCVEMLIDNQLIRVATTHFTWSNDGNVTDEQRINLKSLLEVLAPYKELILAGDFNTPRGKELYATLSEEFKDTIPAHVETTIDGERHQ